MKFLLVLVALFCLTYCDTPQFEETAYDKISQDFETDVENAEDPLAKKEDKDVSSEALIRYITCTSCICTKTNAYGYASYALCYRCSDYRTKYWRICYGCYCCGRQYGVWDVYYAFCRKCK